MFKILKFKHRLKIKNFKLRINSGFTLIELLVVIAIIGVLSSFLVTNFVGVRQRGRDSQRKSDLRQIQASMELWRSDHGLYPTQAAGVNILPACNGQFVDPSTGTVYMQKTPCDPQSGGKYQACTYNSSNNYYLRACLENGNDSQADAPQNPAVDSNCSALITSCPGGLYSYTLQNP